MINFKTTTMANKLVPLLTVEKRSPADALAVLEDQGETDLPCVKTVYNAIHAKHLPILISDLPYRRSERKREPSPQRRKAYTARKNTSIEEWTKEIKERLPRATQVEVEKALKRIRERIEAEENTSKIESILAGKGLPAAY